MSDWAEYNTGLPVNHASRALKPFYRDGKIRSGSNIGFWHNQLQTSYTHIVHETHFTSMIILS
jgi:hypothetical protein